MADLDVAAFEEARKTFASRTALLPAECVAEVNGALASAIRVYKETEPAAAATTGLSDDATVGYFARKLNGIAEDWRKVHENKDGQFSTDKAAYARTHQLMFQVLALDVEFQAVVTRKLGAMIEAHAMAPDCDWPAGGLFSMVDDPDEHKPCYLIEPGGAMHAFTHHGVNGVDQARVKFIMDACNAVLSGRGAKWLYPAEATPALKDVLSRMLWHTTPIAHAFQAAGEPIPPRAEEEQAFVLHWLIGLALEHGPRWREKAAEKLTELSHVHQAKKKASAS